MRFTSISLQQYRNVPFARLEFAGKRSFLLGSNGQGKTNLLEALGLITVLRSFRTPDTKTLIQEGTAQAQIRYEVEHDAQGPTQVLLTLKHKGKELMHDGEPVKRLADFIGLFSTVTLAADDIMLLRGSPALRRRLLDLTLSAVDKTYFEALQGYNKALQQRNQLLKVKGDAASFIAFEQALSERAMTLIAKRKDGLDTLATHLTTCYAQIATADEAPTLSYKPKDTPESASAFAQKLHESRERDMILKATQNGPHRDDFNFGLKGGDAKDFGSEGQQRALVLGLKLAQAAFYEAHKNVKPVILADDILGQLDPERQSRFWSAVGEDAQVIATGTVKPDENWQIYQVSAGSFSPSQSDKNS